MNAYRLDREEALKEEFMIVHEMLDIIPDGNDVLSSSSSPTSSAGELHFPKLLTKRSSSFLGQGDSTSDFYDNNKITWRPKG
nr:BFH_HP1_G0048870.mRNA.1.CDS.1 [Saccharomyces cerevisiae]